MSNGGKRKDKGGEDKSNSTQFLETEEGTWNTGKEMNLGQNKSKLFTKTLSHPLEPPPNQHHPSF